MSEKWNSVEVTSRTDFLNVAGVVEGGMVLVAIAAGWLVGVSPFEYLRWELDAVPVGLLATLPMFAGYYLVKEPRNQAVELLGDALSRCRWDDLILVGALAGFGEEVLFRGVLQPWLATWNPTFAFIAVNLLFGAVHFVSVSYFLVVTIVGMYLSWLAYGIGEPNLWRAIIAHGAYDAIAFFLIVRQHRESVQS